MRNEELETANTSCIILFVLGLVLLILLTVTLVSWANISREQVIREAALKEHIFCLENPKACRVIREYTVIK